MVEDFPGGGETGELIRSFDWSTTPLGPREKWPMSLKSIVRTMLHARQPMIVWWGPELTQIYNDAMLDSMRDKHPRGMGEPARQAWQQAWLAVGHELQGVVDHGNAIWNEDMFVPVDRNSRIEDAWWTYSYSPVFDDDGTRAGILIICTETTAGVVARTQLERAKREADIARAELHDAFMQAPLPIAILIGPDFVFTLANPAYEHLVARQVMGLPLRSAFTVEEVGYYLPLLEKVCHTGVPFEVHAAELRLPNAEGVVELRYIDVAYHPYRNADLETIGVIALINDVTASVTARLDAERRQAERAAMFEREQELRIAAEASGRARDEFLAMLGHELRNPLAPIATAAEVMRLRGDHHPRERQIIERQVTHVSQLVDDLLDVARVTRGKLELRRTLLDLDEVVSRAIEQASPLIASRGHELRRTHPSAPLTVDGDAVRLAQVVANLLTNAAKYIPPHGRIEVSVARQGDDAVVTVGDTGPGISPALLPRVFDLFVQGERRADRSEGGLGIGLALVKHLVAMHGGTVTARNREEGGAELTVRLPAVNAEASHAPAPLDNRPTSNGPKKVLIVDDNEDAALMLSEVLSTIGHDVAVAHDGPHALEMLDAFSADLAILDVGLPGMDGLTLARAIRARPTGATIRLAALTGYGRPQDRKATAAAGFDLHLTKPVAIADVLRFVDG